MRIYVETNWLIACVLPHHELRTEALRLLADADAGKCQLRIPEVAFLEARHVVQRETKDHAKAIKTTAESLMSAARSAGRSDLRNLAHALVNAEASYRLPNPQKSLAELSKSCRRFAFSNPVQEQRALDDLGSQMGMRGADITDLYILAAVAADRGLSPEGRSAFMSTNSHEFAVHRSSTKIRRDFYVSRRLVYLDKFDLTRAESQWAKDEASGWAAPRAPQEDPRRREAQGVLSSLPGEALVKALDALKSLLPS